MKYRSTKTGHKTMDPITRPLPNALNACLKEDLTVIYHFLCACICCVLYKTNSIERMKKKCSTKLVCVIIITLVPWITTMYETCVCCWWYEKFSPSEVKVKTIIHHFMRKLPSNENYLVMSTLFEDVVHTI